MQAIIKSTNPNLLSILNKNPNSFFGMFLKETRNGVMVGECISEGEYHLFFQDGNDLNEKEHSFSEDATNQIDFYSFCNPIGYITLINNILPDIIKEKDLVLSKKISWLENKEIKELEGDNYTTTVSIPSVYIDSTWAKKDGSFVLARYFPEIKNFTHKVGNIYSFEITTDSIIKSINLTLFVNMMLAVTNKQFFKVDNDMIGKYIRILSNIGNIPYFIIYLFKVRLLNEKYHFDLFKNKLEEISQTKLTYGNTHQARIDFVKELFDGDTHILDVGCGELIYAKKLMPKFTNDLLTYYAVDIDEDYAEVAIKLQARFKNILQFNTEIPELKEIFTAIMSEVIEHMEEGESIETILKILNNPYCQKLIITTPNKDFNQFYLLEENELRREDHLKEYTKSEFSYFYHKISINFVDKYNFDFVNIGDTYQGITPTFGLIITRK